jgi:hypothetical protein
MATIIWIRFILTNLIAMAFERKQQRLLPFKEFAGRQAKFALASAFMIFASIGLGAAGYAYFADLDWVDAIYNACMILTGMGPVNVLPTDSGKLFASAYALFSGVAFLTTAAVLFAPMIHRLLHIMHLDDERESNNTSL